MYRVIMVLLVLSPAGYAHAQGLHFSQYYNAPMLLNPANTALTSDADYRLGVNYRNQWAGLPVPFNTFSGFADFQLLRNRNITNWMGMGLAFFSDQAGDGQLAMNKYEGFLAYHIQAGNNSMISVGGSGAFVQRSVDYSKLSFDRQWDGFKFDPSWSSGETGYKETTEYIDVSAGVNYAYYPNENTYIKLGLGAAHVNMPKETFYNQVNTIKIRPTANLDAIFVMGREQSFTLNPSVYYTRQSGTQQLVYGTQVKILLAEDDMGNPTSVILGSYHRYDDAIVGVMGFQWAGVRFTTSYDFSMSTMRVKGNGALEFSLIYEGSYYGDRDKMNCPRF